MSGAVGAYLRDSRRLSVGLVMVLPLLSVYELGILLSGSSVENHAGLLVKRMIRALGLDAYTWLTAAVALLFVAAVLVKHGGAAKGFKWYGWVLVEGAAWAALLGPVVLRARLLLTGLSAAPAGDSVAMAAILRMGAGVWEEIVFRLLLLGGPLLLLGRGAARIPFAAVALLVSAALFAAFHHVGSMAEPLTAGAFLFRFLAGLWLGGIFLWRGLAVGVYTHAFYNLGLLLFRGL